MAESPTKAYGTLIDYPTIIGLSMLAYTLATLLHEHLGHALTCVILGGHLMELGAFYVDFQQANMPDLHIRLVALAGPSVSLIVGFIAFLMFDRLPRSSPHTRYWMWLFATINLMVATGYLLFSGFTGLGDLGTSRDGALYLVQPEWLWRGALTALGVGGYAMVIRFSLRRMDGLIGGEGTARVAHAQRLALTSYLAGTSMSVLTGFLNPHGIVIVLMSAAASTLGGTSGLAWMMSMLDRNKVSPDPSLQLKRSWFWIIAGSAVTVLYAVILGPTVRP